MGCIEPYKILLVISEGVGFLLNGLTIFLISKLGLKATDMWLAVVMAICDIILSSSILMEFIVSFVLGPDSFMTEPSLITPFCAILFFALISSIACIGYLGLIRWLVICRKYQVSELRCWWWIYLGHMSVILGLIIACATNGGFLITPGRYSYFDFHAQNLPALLTRVATLITVFSCFLIFNIAYVLICKQYLQHLNSLPGYRSRVEKRVLQVEKFKVLAKISLILLLYNITLVPFFVVDFTELIMERQRSIADSLVSGQVVLCIAFVNPTILVTMHCETWREVKKLFTKPRKMRHYPVLEELDSSVGLTTYRSRDQK